MKMCIRDSSIIKEKRFGFEEVAYLLLSGHLPDKEELSSFCELINDNTPLDVYKRQLHSIPSVFIHSIGVS